MDANRAVHAAVAVARQPPPRADRPGPVDDGERVVLLAVRPGAGHHARRVQAEHRALLEGLEAGDGPEARRLMEAAIGGFRDARVSAFVASAPLLDAALRP